MSDVNAVLSDVFRRTLGYTGPITDDLGPTGAPGWDSLGQICIVEALEARLGIHLTVDEMVSMVDVKSMKAVLAKHGAA